MSEAIDIREDMRHDVSCRSRTASFDVCKHCIRRRVLFVYGSEEPRLRLLG